MYALSCKLCKVNFDCRLKNQKYCSVNCKYNARIGIKYSQETKDKIAKSNSKPHTQDRKDAIREARLTRLSKKKYDLLVSYLSDHLRTDASIINHFNFSNRLYYRFKKEIIEKYNLGDVEEKRLVLFERMNLDSKKIEWLKENYKNYNCIEIKDKLKMNCANSTIRKLCKKIFGSHPKRIMSKTRPESEFENFLISNKISYEYNKMLRYVYEGKSRWFSIDFVIEDKIFIEVQGDFWHANPAKYKDYNKLYERQKIIIARDINKKNIVSILFSKYHFIPVWEHDIINCTENYDTIKKEILCLLRK